MKLALFFINLLIISNVCSKKFSQLTKPNIVFILIDDLGYNDVGYHGSEIYTPNIDKLAREGVRLENYYVQPICTPTRSQLLSGRYQIHTGLQHSYIRPAQPLCLPTNLPTFADKLREAGYATHAVGKWHLGFYKKECLPTQRGFDSYFGYLTGAWEYGGYYSAFVFTEKIQQIVAQHPVEQPFLLYLPFQSVHSPLQVPSSYEERYKNIKNTNRRIYAGMMTCLDEAVGKIVHSLQQAGLWDNTVLIFSTDNGGEVAAGGNNWPLRGWKRSIWEGGMRGVGFVNSPLLPASVQGTVNKQLIHVSDWFPTLVQGVAGSSLDNITLDGFNMWKTIREELQKCRTSIEALTLERDHVMIQLDICQREGHSANMYRLESKLGKLAKELEAEGMLEAQIVDRLDIAELHLSRFDLDRGKYLLEEEELQKKEADLELERKGNAARRAQKESKYLSQAEQRRKIRDRPEESLLDENGTKTSPTQKFSRDDKLRMLALRRHLDNLDGQLLDQENIVDTTREELQKCRTSIEALTLERDHVMIQLDICQREGHSANMYRLESKLGKLAKELEAEGMLEAQIVDRLDIAELHLSRFDLDRGKYLLEEEELQKKEADLELERKGNAARRAQKESKYLSQAEQRRKIRDRDHIEALMEHDRKHREALSAAKKSQEVASQYLKQSLAKYRQEEADELVKEKAHAEKRMGTLLKLKQDINSNRDNLKALQARNRYEAKLDRKESEQEREQLIEGGENSAEVMLTKNRIDERENNKK
eukprot:XP_011678877.1 PREDICTED: uncharacterized protein LOC763377 [Strongylocentrotus purpuratus]